MSNYDMVSKMVEEQRDMSMAELLKGDVERNTNLYTDEDRPDTLSDFGYRIANAQVIGFLQAQLTMALNELDMIKELGNEQA